MAFVDFTDLITFSRGSSGTRVNASGVLETITSGNPRFDYDPVTHDKLGLLIEEQRTNLVLRSEAITTSPWTAYGGTGASLAAIAAVDGATTALGLNDTDGSAYYGYTQAVTIAASTTYTFSVFVKQGTNSTGFSVWLIGSGGNTYYQNTISWTAGVPTATGWTATPWLSGWYRLTYTFASTTSTSVALYLLPGPTSTAATGSTYFWGVQLEVGSFATTYIATAGSQVTRSVDVPSIGGSHFTDIINLAEGTFIAEGATISDVGTPTRTLAAISAGASYGAGYGFLLRTNGLFITAGGNSSGVNSNYTHVARVPFKAAGAYKGLIAKSAVNGGNLASISNCDFTGAGSTTIVLGALTTTGSQPINGWLRSLIYYPELLSDAQLQSLTL